MAIRILKDRNKPFQVYWRNPFTNKLQSKSVATKEEAEKLNAFIKYQLKYERDQFRPEDLTPVEPEVQTVESIFYLYLRDRNLSKSNLERTLGAAKCIIAKFGDTPIQDVDHKLLLSMQQTLILTGIKGSTVHRRMGIIKAATHWAHLNGFIENMPIFPPSPKSVPNRYVPPTQEEISRIYQVASPHLRRAIILGFMFGLRIGPCELLKLTWDDIDLQQMVIRVPNANKGVSELWREVPMTANMVSLFTSWQKEDKRLGQRYVIHYKGKPVKNIRTGWLGALKRAGISRHIRPYDLRHGFATQAIESGADYGTVAELMGHRSPMMVLRHYQHVNNAQKKRVMDKIPQPILAEKVI